MCASGFIIRNVMNNLRDEICWYKSHITDMEEEFKLILDEKDAEIAELKE